MRVVLGFPYRGVQRFREEIFSIVKTKVTEMYPWDGVVVGDSGHDQFNRAATRNSIVREAHEMGADVVVICDADSIPEDFNLHIGIKRAFERDEFVVPFETVRVIHYKSVFRSYADYKTIPEVRTYGPSCGGIFICRPSTWAFLGGMDERIQGWGYEDQIFLVALKTFLRGYTSLQGILYNFEHPRGHDYLPDSGNAELRDKYHQVFKKPAAVRRLSVGSNDFCTDEGSPESIARLWGRVS